jgi:hypothetical protein
LNYDRETHNGTIRLREKVISGLPSKPTVYKINLFKLASASSSDDKIKHLLDEAGVTQVSEQVNLEAFNEKQ